MKKKLALMVCVSMMALAGCSSSSNDSADQQNDSAVEETTTDDEATDEDATEMEDELEDIITENTLELATENLDEVVMTINGVEISKALYMLYDYTTTQNFYAMTYSTPWDSEAEGMTEQEFIDERIMETLKSIVATGTYADENDVALDEEDLAEIDMASSEFMNNLPADIAAKIGFTTETLTPHMAESYVHSITFEEMSLGYVIDEVAYKEYFDENAEAIGKDYTQLELNSILVEDLALAEEVAGKAEAGEDFDELFRTYDISMMEADSEETGYLTISQGQFLNTFPTIDENITSGQIIGPVEMNASYFVFIVENLDAPTEEDLDDLVSSIFEGNSQIEYADNLILEMIEGMEVEINDSVMSDIEKFYQPY